ncbi:hypothetical protein HDU84_004810 [Entophlyctis sp. JEL0112]|nr:hypothetical protein HDU84_004810 [Entophlyctis sp. JEL0112]
MLSIAIPRRRNSSTVESSYSASSSSLSSSFSSPQTPQSVPQRKFDSVSFIKSSSASSPISTRERTMSLYHVHLGAFSPKASFLE